MFNGVEIGRSLFSVNGGLWFLGKFKRNILLDSITNSLKCLLILFLNLLSQVKWCKKDLWVLLCLEGFGYKE